MTAITHPDSDFSGNLPLLTQVAGKVGPDDLPTLTEIVAGTTTHLNPALSGKEQHLLLHKIEKNLESLFTKKLALQLEQLHRQAVKQALSELKAELPELLRDALNTHLDSR